MIVLHAAIHDGRLILWGEAPGGAVPSCGRERRAGRPKRRSKAPARHPLDAGRDALFEAVRLAAPLDIAADEGVLWLPTAAGAPVPSGPLVGEPPAGRPELAPWTVASVSIPARESVELLSACAGKDTLVPGVVVGKDLAFWAMALRLAGSIVARERYLPGVAERDGKWRAVWEPVLSGPDAEAVSKLARACPASARAACDDAKAPPATPASEVLRGFLALAVDALVRPAQRTLSPEEEIRLEGGPARLRPRKGKRPAFESIHDEWLWALRSPDGLMRRNRAEMEALAEQVREWRRPVDVTSAAPFRLCFRLEEPPAADEGGEAAPVRPGRGDWRVRFLLQAADDPSLLVPAELAWNGGRKAAGLRRNGFDAREYLLVALGEAARICPRIDRSLNVRAPSGYELDATGAHEFLAQKSLLLEQAGFGVMLPAWWTRTGTKTRLSVRASVKSPKMQGGSGLSLDDIVDFDWEVALGGERLTLGELRSLARLKAPLVRFRGQWVEVRAEEIRAALDFWKRKGDSATAGEVLRMALGAPGEVPAGVDFGGVRADGWMGELLARLDGRSAFEELVAPEGFRGELRPYQLRGYSWLEFLGRWGLGACLADDMGLGKTIQTLALVLKRRAEGEKRPFLLVCPMSVVGNWVKEAARFAPELAVAVHHGIERAKGPAFGREIAGKALVVTSYALLHRDVELFKNARWAGVVLDEAQNVKNPETKQSKAARSLEADLRIALTGTPVENNVGDLWAIMEFLNPGLLGTQAEFKRRFFVPIQATRDAEAAARLKKLTGPFVLRRLKTDKAVIADLPEKLEMKVFCTLTKEQASLYQAVVEESTAALEDADGIRRKGVVLATLSKLKQVSNHPAQFLGDNSPIPGRSGKLARLVEMLEEVLEAGERALVFSQFSEMGAILKRHLEETFGREALFLHGGVPKRKRDEMVERFQSEDGPAVFVLSLKAGGTGLNLTRANHVFHFDRWWNPAVENQATDRAFRIGQTRNVQVHKFVCAGTLEEKIDEMIERKKVVAESVVGAGEAWLTELSTEELKGLFALGAGAVAE